MRRLIYGLTAALALGFVATARADDTQKTTESKSTQKSTEAKDTNPSSTDMTKEGTGGSGTTTKTEKKTKTEHDTTKPDESKTAPAK